MQDEQLRAWWFHRQGLDGSQSGQPIGSVLERTGWTRSLGGSSPYLGFHARQCAGRQAVDRAVEALEIHELPSARGCTYVVPAADFALALKLSQSFGPEADMRVARKLGVTDAEIDRLCQAVLEALRAGPASPEELRAATGGAARSLGEEGKKKGVTTTLPLALGRLQTEGEIRRVPTNGRLDQQRYRYTLWRPNPLAGFSLSDEECHARLARLFFTWIGPASLADFQAFSALGVKAARAAVEPLQLAPLADGDERLLLAEQREELAAFAAPGRPGYALVGNLDGMLQLRRGVKHLVAQPDGKRPAFDEKGQPQEVGSLGHLPNHAILDRGRLVGLWEFDPEAGEIVWTCFTTPDAALRERIAGTQALIREELGDMRSFSLDSPQSRVPRIQALRAAAAS